MHYFWKICHVHGGIYEESKQHRRKVIGKNTGTWKGGEGQNVSMPYGCGL